MCHSPRRRTLEFNIDDIAVYPAHGVGTVKRIVAEPEMEGLQAPYYVLELANGTTIYVPVANAEAVGMRRVISVEHVERVYEVLGQRDVPADNQTWNRRYREYMNRIKTGDPLEVAKVLRDLALLRSDKTLSFGERKMFDQARSLLAQELSVAKGVDEESIGEEIDKIFKS
jgi:CarD family transcriptional regulator